MGTEFLITLGVFQVLFGAIFLWRSRHYAKLNQRAREESEALSKRAREESEALREKRRADLCTRFGEENAARILAHEVWHGATYAMLWESIGYPDGITEKFTARREREIYKYCETAKGRFALKVTVDDGIVTGWDGDRELAAAEARALEARRDYQTPVASYQTPVASYWTAGKTVVASGAMAFLVTGVRFCTDPKALVPTAQDDIASPLASPSSPPARSTAIPRAKASAPIPRLPLSRPRDAGPDTGAASASAQGDREAPNSQPTPSATTTGAPKAPVDPQDDYE